MLMLGVGKPNLLYNHNEIVKNNVVVRTVETIKKNSKYYIRLQFFFYKLVSF